MRYASGEYRTGQSLGDIHRRPLHNESVSMLLWMRKEEIGASRRRLIIYPPPRGKWWLARFECAPHSRWRKADGASKSGREVTMGCEAEIECQRAQMEIPVAQPGER